MYQGLRLVDLLIHDKSQLDTNYCRHRSKAKYVQLQQNRAPILLLRQ